MVEILRELKHLPEWFRKEPELEVKLYFERRMNLNNYQELFGAVGFISIDRRIEQRQYLAKTAIR
jgi:hypothetical protein